MRCQRTTVSGVTSGSGFFHPDHSFRSETQNTLSEAGLSIRSAIADSAAGYMNFTAARQPMIHRCTSTCGRRYGVKCRTG